MFPLVRRLPAALLAVVTVPAAVVALPVLTPPAAAPHPVAPAVRTLAVTGAAPAAAAHAARATAPDAPALQTAPETGVGGFDLVGARWDRGTLAPGARVQVRVRAGGHWTGWTDLTPADGGPDAGSPDARRAGGVRASEPVWVGAADGVQTRVVGTAPGRVPAHLKVVLVDGGRSAADATVGRAAPASSAYAAETRPQIYTRAQWGADESLRQRACPGGPEYTSTVKVGFVHHTDTANGYTPDQVPSIIRSIYAYHVQSNGWCDIGYNFLVDRFGRIWEGRYGGVDKPVLGAHTGGFNTDSFGTAVIGTYASAGAPSAAVDAIERLFAWRLGLANRDPAGSATLTASAFSGSRYPAGTRVTFRTISGHRDADSTSCPGDALYAQLAGLRGPTRALVGAGFVDPTVTGSRVVSGDGQQVQVSAGLLQPVSWQLTVTDHLTGALVRQVSGSAGSSVTATWDVRDAQGLPVLPGSYDLRLDGWNGGDAAAPFTATVQVADPGGASWTGDPSAVSLQQAAANADGAAATAVALDPAVRPRVLAADWTDGGVDTPAEVTVSGGQLDWTVGGSSFLYGPASCLPVAGDWDGDGRATPGLACPDGGSWRWRLSDTLGPAAPVLDFHWGSTTGYPVVGDWNGDGVTTVGTATPGAGGMTWQVADQAADGAPVTASTTFGDPAGTPVTADWNGDRTTGIGTVTRDSAGLHWTLQDLVAGGAQYPSFTLGGPADLPLPGRWTPGAGATAGAVTVSAPVPPPAPSPSPTPTPTDSPGPGPTPGPQQSRPPAGDAPQQPYTSTAPLDPRQLTWRLAGGNADGTTAAAFTYGPAAGRALVGDWTGAGRDTVAVVDAVDGQWRWRMSPVNGSSAPSITFRYGPTRCRPVAGDWNGDGTTTAGVVCAEHGLWRWRLTDVNASSSPVHDFTYGPDTTTPVVGRWAGAAAGVGVVRPRDGQLYWQLRDTASAGAASHVFFYGGSGDTPVVGDWNGDGRATVGAIRGDGTRWLWQLRDAVTGGPASVRLHFGTTDGAPVTGDWDGGGTTTVGLVQPRTAGAR